MLIFHSKHPKNRVTIVGEYCEDGLCLTAARCSDKDNFCRKTGREKAVSRFSVKRHCLNLSTDDKTIKTFVEVAKQLADFVSSNIKFKQELNTFTIK